MHPIQPHTSWQPHTPEEKRRSWAQVGMTLFLTLTVIACCMLVATESMKLAHEHLNAKEIMGEGFDESREMQDYFHEIREVYHEGIPVVQEALLLSSLASLVGGVLLLMITKPKSESLITPPIWSCSRVIVWDSPAAPPDFPLQRYGE